MENDLKIKLAAQSSTPKKTITLSVVPQYANAEDWAYYVRRSDNVTACDGTETGVSPCMHGGDKKKVVLTGVSSCAGLTMTDSLGAFYWRCEVVSGTATFFGALKPEKGLKDLITVSGWSHPTVTLNGGEFSGTTSSAIATWWGNDIIEVPDNSSTCTAVPSIVSCDTSERARLLKAGAVYVVSSTKISKGYRIAADNISFTTLPGVILKTNPHIKNCSYNGDDEDPSTGSHCSVMTYKNKFLWIEGNLTSSSDPEEPSISWWTFPLNVRATTHSTFRNIETTLSNEDSIIITGSSSNTFNNIKITNADSGFWIEESADATYMLKDNVFSRLFLSSLVSKGLNMSDGENTYLSAVTVSSTNDGLHIENSFNNSVIHNLLSFNNSGAGVFIQNGLNVTYSQMAILENATGLDINHNSLSKLTGNLLLGNNSVANCNINGNVPLDANCDNDVVNSNPDSPSDSNKVTGVDISASFVGGIDTLAFASWPVTTDWEANQWVYFDNYYKVWGPTASFLDLATAGRCDSSRAHCALFDISMLATDSVVRNTTDAGNSANDAFTIGANCPAVVHGNKVLQNDEADKTFMKNAIEIDGAGNGNGLCESGETCLYTPNFGYYQGHGSFGQCTFTDGTIVGVKMFGYAINGY